MRSDAVLSPTLVILLAPPFAGFLLLPWMQCRYSSASAFRRGPALVAVALVALLFGVMASADWTNPLRVWLSTPSASANRMLPLVWALYALPLWGLAWIASPAALREISAWLGARQAPPAAAGWLMIAAAWCLFALVATVL
jgi:hypothetical protein